MALARESMRRRCLLLLLLPAVVACRPPPPVPVTAAHAHAQVALPPPQPPPPSPPPPVVPPPVLPPRPLDERLAAEVGQGGAVLLDLREDGVWAKSVDGTRKERLLAGEATWLWPDARTRVLWLWREADGALAALDLAVPLPQAVTVATGVSNGLAWHWDKDATLGPEDARLRLSFEARNVGFQFRLPPEPGHWHAPPRWKLCARAKHEEALGICPEIAPGTDALLPLLANRAREHQPRPRLGRAGPQPPACSATTCGPAHALPGTQWWLVPATVWSDCCRLGHQLYDPRTHRFLRLGSGKLQPTASGDRRDTVEFVWICPPGDVLVTESGAVPLEPPGALRFGDADACLGGQPLRTPSLPCPQGDQCEDEPAEGVPADAKPL